MFAFRPLYFGFCFDCAAAPPCKNHRSCSLSRRLHYCNIKYPNLVMIVHVQQSNTNSDSLCFLKLLFFYHCNTGACDFVIMSNFRCSGVVCFGLYTYIDIDISHLLKIDPENEHWLSLMSVTHAKQRGADGYMCQLCAIYVSTWRKREELKRILFHVSFLKMRGVCGWLVSSCRDVLSKQ